MAAAVVPLLRARLALEVKLVARRDGGAAEKVLHNEKVVRLPEQPLALALAGHRLARRRKRWNSGLCKRRSGTTAAATGVRGAGGAASAGERRP